MIKFNHGQRLANCNPSPGKCGGRAGWTRRPFRAPATMLPSLPFGLKKKKEPTWACDWEKEKISSVLFLYLFKLSLIPLIVLELIWLNSLSPCERPLAIFWKFFQSPQHGKKGGEAKVGAGAGREARLQDIRGDNSTKLLSEIRNTHLLPLGWGIQPASSGRS